MVARRMALPGEALPGCGPVLVEVIRRDVRREDGENAEEERDADPGPEQPLRQASCFPDRAEEPTQRAHTGRAGAAGLGGQRRPTAGTTSRERRARHQYLTRGSMIAPQMS